MSTVALGEQSPELIELGRVLPALGQKSRQVRLIDGALARGQGINMPFVGIHTDYMVPFARETRRGAEPQLAQADR